MGKRPTRTQRVKCAPVQPKESLTQRLRVLGAEIRGEDDAGRKYENLCELWLVQGQQRDKFYKVNEEWWLEGYEGRQTLEGAMIGDDETQEDTAHSAAFLRSALADSALAASGRALAALDVGAGLGRVSKAVLLPAVQTVTLVDQSAKWLKAALTYLGHDAKRCSFVQSRLEEFQPETSFDVIWIQWTLQYLIDADVVNLLQRLATSLRPEGIILLKENRPVYSQSECFQMDTPNKEGRFDITRPEKHLGVLVALAGLSVSHVETWDECSCWVLTSPKDLP
ncbi:unnamed protein product [Effrenium voratum]|nr:unnamed protein product [Effrenium voratum]